MTQLSARAITHRDVPRAHLGLRNLHLLSWSEYFFWRVLLLYLEVRYFLHYSGILSSMWALRSTDSYFVNWECGMIHWTESEILKYFLTSFSSSLIKCVGWETSLWLKTNGFFQGGSRKDSTNISVLSLIPRAFSQEGSLRDLKGQLTKQKLVSSSDFFP